MLNPHQQDLVDRLFTTDYPILSTSNVTVTSQATAQPFAIANIAGILFLFDGTNSASMLLNAAAASIILQSGTRYSVAQGTLTKVNIYYSAGILTVENLTTTDLTFSIRVL